MHASIRWVGLAVALSPALADLVQHWGSEPWTRYSILFVPLWLACALRDPGPPRPHAAGYAWLALGLTISLVTVAGGIPRFSRPGIAAAVVGLALALGTPSLPRALLVAWVVPVPNLIVRAGSGLEILLGQSLSAAARASGADLALRPTLEGVELVSAAGAVPLRPEQGGLVLAVLLAGLAWYAAVRQGAAIRTAFATALRWAPWALLLQPLAILAAVALLLVGAPSAARLVLDPGAACTIAVLALLHIHRADLARLVGGTARLREPRS